MLRRSVIGMIVSFRAETFFFPSGSPVSKHRDYNLKRNITFTVDL
jgi:hypothetical protein